MSAPTTNPPDHKPPKKKRAPNWLPLKENNLLYLGSTSARSLNLQRINQARLSFSRLRLTSTPGQRYNIIAAPNRLRPGKLKIKPISAHFSGCLLFFDYRWTGLNTATLKFSAIYNSIQRNPPSGASPDDWITTAKRIYQDQSKALVFTSMLAWQKLCNTAKWRVNCNTDLTTSSVGLLSDPINGDLSATALGFSTPTVQSASSLANPIGQKAAKKRRIDKSREGGSVLLFAEVVQEQLAVINANNELTKEQKSISCK
jgi:hypothetical protein